MNGNSTAGVLEKINLEYYTFTASEKKIADFITAHPTEVQRMSISQLASAGNIAEATVSRFARRLGFKNFNEMKLSLARTVVSGNHDPNPVSGNVSEDDSFTDVCAKVCAADIEAIRQTCDLIDEEKIHAAADLMEKAKLVVCMGQGGSMIIADEAAHLFRTIGNKYFAVSDSHTQAIIAATLNKDDVIMFFSYSGATVEALQTLKLAHENGVKVVIITRYPASPAVAYADVVLQCGSNESPLQLGSAAAKIAQIFLLDILFSEMCMRDLQGCRNVREKIADALSEKHVRRF